MRRRKKVEESPKVEEKVESKVEPKVEPKVELEVVVPPPVVEAKV